jgi:hypothetical protein
MASQKIVAQILLDEHPIEEIQRLLTDVAHDLELPCVDHLSRIERIVNSGVLTPDVAHPMFMNDFIFAAQSRGYKVWKTSRWFALTVPQAVS